jgi:hypothetical protein
MHRRGIRPPQRWFEAVELEQAGIFSDFYWESSVISYSNLRFMWTLSTPCLALMYALNVLCMCGSVCADRACVVLCMCGTGGSVERRKFPNSGDYMDWFNGSYYRNGFSFKEVRMSKN